MFNKRPNHCCPPPRPMCNPCEGMQHPSMTLPTCSQELPAVVHPTMHNVVESTQEYIVPEIHPSHTTHVKNHVYKHIHHYPHSDSVTENVKNEQYCEKPMMNNNWMANNMAPTNNMAPSNMKPSNVSPANMKPSNMAQSNMKPSNVSPANMKPSNVSPYSGFKKII